MAIKDYNKEKLKTDQEFFKFFGTVFVLISSGLIAWLSSGVVFQSEKMVYCLLVVS